MNPVKPSIFGGRVPLSSGFQTAQGLQPPMRVELLDSTLRDGSYSVDFQFTAADTAIIVGMLDAAGVGFIELGHGSGSFNHKAPPEFRSPIRQAATDEEYFAAARRCATRSKLGIISGPFGMDDLPIVAEHGLDFLRMAVMADRALEPRNLAMAEKAKSLGLTFSLNLMQTTAITPARVVEVAQEYEKAGTDWLYIVDSSGGLLPDAVVEYVTRVKQSCALTIGFHAHHNSGLAIANCLAAIEAGATMVDGTLQGLGRDVGNAPTEQLLFMLQRLGFERAIDVEQLCHAGDLVRKLLVAKGQDPTYYASGISEIHSSNVRALVDLAERRGIGARSLLAAIAQGSTKLIGAGMKKFPDEIIEPAIAKAARAAAPEPRGAIVEVVADDIARASSSDLPVLVDALFARATKAHKTSVLHLVPAREIPFAAPVPWMLDRWCGVTVGIDAAAARALDLGDRTPAIIISDPTLPITAPADVVTLSDPFLPVVIDATLALVAACVSDRFRVSLVCSDAPTAAQLATRIPAGCRVLGPGEESQVLPDDDVVILVGHTQVPASIAALATRGVRLLRPPLASAVAARVAVLMEIRERLEQGGRGELVDPIFVPKPNQVVVDDPACPSTVLGDRDPVAMRRAALARTRKLLRGRGRL